MLEISHLTFSQPANPRTGQVATYVYDMQVGPGEIVVVTGVSGAGKSTLLDLIAGFLKLHGGTLSLNGAEFTSLPPEHRPVSILFQEDNLFAHLSVEKNLALALGRDVKKRALAEKTENALCEVELDGLGDRRADDLSGGQKQRVALARTLLRNKPVLLLDEPFANLDDSTADQMRALVRKFTSRHRWHTLIVSHSRKDALGLADRTYHLADGQLMLQK